MELDVKVYELRKKWGWMDDTQDIVDELEKMQSDLEQNPSLTKEQIDLYTEKADAAVVIFYYYRDEYSNILATLLQTLKTLKEKTVQNRIKLDHFYKNWMFASKQLKTIESQHKEELKRHFADEHDLHDIKEGIAWLDQNMGKDFMQPVQQQATRVRKYLKGQETIRLYNSSEGWKRKLKDAADEEARTSKSTTKWKLTWNTHSSWSNN